MLKQSYLTKKVKYVPTILGNQRKTIERIKLEEYLSSYDFYEIEMITRLNEKLTSFHPFEENIIQGCLLNFNKILQKMKDLLFIINENNNEKEKFLNKYQLFLSNGDVNVAERIKLFNRRNEELLAIKEDYGKDEYLVYLQLYYLWFHEIIKTVLQIYPRSNSYIPDFKYVLLKVSKQITKQCNYVTWSRWDIDSINNHPLVVLIEKMALKELSIDFSYRDYVLLYTNKIIHDIFLRGDLICINWFFIMLKKARNEKTMSKGQREVYRNWALAREIISFICGSDIKNYYFPNDYNVVNIKSFLLNTNTKKRKII